MFPLLDGNFSVVMDLILSLSNLMLNLVGFKIEVRVTFIHVLGL